MDISNFRRIDSRAELGQVPFGTIVVELNDLETKDDPAPMAYLRVRETGLGDSEEFIGWEEFGSTCRIRTLAIDLPVIVIWEPA